MSDLTEEEQVEQLKRWWKENGRSILIGILLGGGLLYGWNYWQGAKQDAAESASGIYAAGITSAQANNLVDVSERFETLQNEYADSPYVSQLGLRLAGLQMQRGDSADAQTTLTALLERERGNLIEPVIRARLARVMIYRNETQEALALLDASTADSYAPIFDAIRGDAYVALGESANAREAYQRALDNPGQPQLVDVNELGMKLASIAISESDIQP